MKKCFSGSDVYEKFLVVLKKSFEKFEICLTNFKSIFENWNHSQ